MSTAGHFSTYFSVNFRVTFIHINRRQGNWS